jgi:hypothetical protein
MTLLFAACSGTSGDDFDGSFVLSDANNYSYTSHLGIGAQVVERGADFTIDWSGLTTDLLGHPVDPAADVGEVYLLSFPALSQTEVEDLLATEQLTMSDLLVIAFKTGVTGQTSLMASDLVIPPAAPFQPETYFTDTDATWLVRATDGATTNRMLSFAVPTEGSESHAITLDDGATTLDFAADLHGLDAFSIGEQDAYTVDWSGLTRHADGNSVELLDLDQLMLARYDGLSISELEEQFLDLDLIADALYTADVYGDRTADLSAAVDADGAAFSGFGAGTLWVLALRCTTCANPAPPFLTLVEVE